mgnify:CR=1 FL=1
MVYIDQNRFAYAWLHKNGLAIQLANAIDAFSMDYY